MSKYKKTIEQTVENSFNVRDELKLLSVEELKEVSKSDRLPYRVCSINIEGDLNIGMMIRTSFLLGAERFYVYGRRKFDRRSLVGAQNYLDIVRVSGLDNLGNIGYNKFLDFCNEENMYPVLIETGGESLLGFDWHDIINNPEQKIPCFVFGNEASGFPDDFLRSPLKKISIPQLGVLRSFNVAAAASMVLWHFVSTNYFYKL